MTTNRFSFPWPGSLAVTLLGMWMLVGATPAQGQLILYGRLNDLANDVFESGERSQTTVEVENTGAGPALFRVEVVDVPPDWIVWVDPRQVKSISKGKTADFVLDFTVPNQDTGPEEVTLRLLVQDVSGQIWIERDRKTYTVEGFLPPQRFNLLTPFRTQSNLLQPIDFTWEATNATSFTFRLYDSDGGFPGPEPVFVQEGITGRLFTLSEDIYRLRFWEGYFWDVVAANQVAERVNEGGAWLFSMAAPPPLGEFSFVRPAETNDTLYIRPRFEWTPSQNAQQYSVELYHDNNGSFVEPFFFQTTVTGTSYDWEGDPLEVGPYHVFVAAQLDSTEKGVEGGPRRFIANPVAPFELIYPEADATDVEDRPEFLWQSADGAEGFLFELFREESGGLELVHSVELSPNVTSYLPPFDLERGYTYQWHVIARNAEGDRENEQGLLRFSTYPLGRFELVYPGFNEVGVPLIPTFVWEPSRNALWYRVELAEELNGQPDPANSFVFDRIPADQTSWPSRFEALKKNRGYFWRVRASYDIFDNVTQYSEGDWHPFVTTDLSSFTLLSPSDGSGPFDPEAMTLNWEAVEGAVYFRVYMTLVGLGTLPVIETENAVPQLRFTKSRHLNGEQTYVWTVEAVSSTSRLAASDVWSFTTTGRDEADAEDVIDMLLGKQLLSEEEVNTVNGAPVDISNYVLIKRFE